MRYADIKAPRDLRVWCSVCGRAQATDAAHLDAKGMGGRGAKAPDDADDATPLCRTCHQAEHDLGELHMRRTPDGYLSFTAKGKTARRLGVGEGSWHIARHEMKSLDEPTDFEDAKPDIAGPLGLCEQQIVNYMTHDGEEWRKSAEAVALALDLFLATHDTAKAARAAHREWREQLQSPSGEPMPLDASECSRMLTVVKHLGSEGKGIAKSKQYLVARAVKQGIVPVEDGVALAESLSVSDLIAEWFDSEKPEPTYIECPLGHRCKVTKEA